MLMIRNLTTSETEPLMRDVCHRHSDWVHAQCETATESELQAMLDQTSVEEFQGRPGQSDCCGIYWQIETGDLVEAGDGDDHDTGRVERLDGDTAFVAWDSGVKTLANISALRPL